MVWSHDRHGGYLLNEVMRGHDMVRRGGVSDTNTGRNTLPIPEQDSEGWLSTQSVHNQVAETLDEERLQGR